MRFFLTRHFQYAGLTLIEMLVIASIIIVLSIIVVANYEFGGHQFTLQRSAHRLTQDIRKAEEMAMLVKEFEGSIPPGGYGMNFNLSNPNSYILFADNGDYIYNSDDIIIEEINLGGKIRINRLYEGQIIASILDIVFTPPDPTVSINSDAGYGTISLWSEKTDEIITVYVNLAGLVGIQ